MKWTEEQLMAINESGKNIIVSAGAGSGKTAVLTERVIKKINDGVNVDELLILTFTNAAAREMKDRIKEKLTLLDNKKQLELLDSAYITTFDSFALAMLRKYHYVLNLSPNLSIIDSALINLEKEKIINRIFEEKYINKDFNFLKLVNDFCQKDDKVLRESIININNKLDLKINKTDYLKNYLGNFYDNNKLDYDINSYLNIIFEKINEIKDLLNEISYLVQYDYYENLAESLNNLLNSKTYEEVISNINLKMPALPKNSLDEVKKYKDNISLLIKEIKSLCKYKSVSEIKESILKTYDYVSAILDIILKLDEEIFAYKFKNDLYEFNDIAKLIIKIFKENESIRLEVKDKFIEIMIDEYQDTNDIQEEFIALISDQNVYMVGDIKQSIYKFRNANPDIFKNKYELYSNNLEGLKIDLNKNFRSRCEVINNINLMFNNIMDMSCGGANYLESHQMIFGNETYNLNIPNHSNDLEVYNYSYDKEDKFSKEEIEAFIIALDIQSKIDSNYQVYDKKLKKLRNCQYDDFAILIDKATNFSLYKKIFEYHNIPLNVYKDEKITEDTILVLLKNVLKFIYKIYLNEIDIEFKYLYISICRSPLIELSDQEIFKTFKDEGFKNSELYLKCLKLEKYFSNKSLKDFVNLVIDEFNFIENIIKIGNVKSNITRLEYILNTLNNFSSLGFTIVDFINYLNDIIDKQYDIKISENKDQNNSVKIMTIHKSKGLEYPICYYSGLYSKFNISDLNDLFMYDNLVGIITPYKDEGITSTIYKDILKNNYLKEEISEKVRLFYVALTRAKEKMILLIDNYDLVEEKERISSFDKMKYRSFKDILNSMKKNIQKYEVNIDISKLNLTKEYNRIKETNYLDYIDKSNDIIKISELNVENEIINEDKFSKTQDKLLTKEAKENILYGLKMHEIFEFIDFKNPNLDNIEIDLNTKNKINKFLSQEIFNNIKNGKIYKEYEFSYESDNTNYHGIIDLMVVYDDYIDIIDYKLKDITDEAYINQLNGYKNYIEKKLNKNVNIYLYSIVTNELQKI